MDNPRHTIVVGCLVRNADQAVLLIRHRRRGWEIPQGRVEEGEDLLSAAHREVLEETGVSIELGPLAAVHSKLPPPSALIFTFLATYRAGELRTCEECPEVGWYPPETALRMVENPVNHDRLRTLLEHAGRVIYRGYQTHPFAVQTEAILG